MADPIQLTFVLRQPKTSAAISEKLLAGTYHPGDVNPSAFAADASEAQAVADFATSHNLQVMKIDPATRRVRVAGSAADIEKAFEIQGSVQSLDYKGPIHLPPPLDKFVIAVLGLDQTPIARPHTDGG
jgi:kumamolisin